MNENRISFVRSAAAIHLPDRPSFPYRAASVGDALDRAVWHGVLSARRPYGGRGGKPEAVVGVGRSDDVVPFGGVGDEPDRVFTAADGQGVHLAAAALEGQTSACGRPGRGGAGAEVVGEVLHEAGAAGLSPAMVFNVRSRAVVFQSPSPPKP